MITPLESFGNIIAIKAQGIDSVKLENELKDKNIDVSVREGNIRLSFHLFNRIDQIEKLLEVLNI